MSLELKKPLDTGGISLLIRCIKKEYSKQELSAINRTLSSMLVALENELSPRVTEAIKNVIFAIS